LTLKLLDLSPKYFFFCLSVALTIKHKNEISYKRKWLTKLELVT